MDVRKNNVKRMGIGRLIGEGLVEGLDYRRNHTQKGTHGVGIQKMGIGSKRERDSRF